MTQDPNILNLALLISVILFAIRCAKLEKRVVKIEQKLGINPNEEDEQGEAQFRKLEKEKLKNRLKSPSLKASSQEVKADE